MQSLLSRQFPSHDHFPFLSFPVRLEVTAFQEMSTPVAGGVGTGGVVVGGAVVAGGVVVAGGAVVA